MELVNALAGGDENHFQQNRNRLLVMTSPAKCRFLPMPGQFIRNTGFFLSAGRESAHEQCQLTVSCHLDGSRINSLHVFGGASTATVHFHDKVDVFHVFVTTLVLSRENGIGKR
jgi:hypothetical protein